MSWPPEYMDSEGLNLMERHDLLSDAINNVLAIEELPDEVYERALDKPIEITKRHGEGVFLRDKYPDATPEEWLQMHKKILVGKIADLRDEINDFLAWMPSVCKNDSAATNAVKDLLQTALAREGALDIFDTVKNRASSIPK